MTRAAIVTGAAQGIGRAVALRLAADGIDIAVTDLPSKQGALDQVVGEIQSTGQKAIAVTGDVSKEADVQDIVQKAVEAFGGLDIMVANAAIFVQGPLLELSEEGLDRVMNVNLKSVLYCYRAAAKQMIKQGRGGRIIGATSAAGMQVTLPYNGAYAISKFGVRAITQTAALEWGQYNITVNTYAPGITDTQMVAPVIKGPQGEQLVNAVMGNAAIKRVGQPEEVAAVVGFLASEAASYVTGQTLAVNGGLVLT